MISTPPADDSRRDRRNSVLLAGLLAVTAAVGAIAVGHEAALLDPVIAVGGLLATGVITIGWRYLEDAPEWQVLAAVIAVGAFIGAVYPEDSNVAFGFVAWLFAGRVLLDGWQWHRSDRSGRQ